MYVTPAGGSTPRHLEGVARQLEGVAVGGEGGIYMQEVKAAGLGLKVVQPCVCLIRMEHGVAWPA